MPPDTDSLPDHSPEMSAGPLPPCPSSPNCVCSFGPSQRQRMTPLKFTGSPAEAIAKLRQLVLQLPRVQAVEQRDDYLHVTSTSRWLRFVDDVEFYAQAETQLLHFRSASRIGYSDLGANRRRMQQWTHYLSQHGFQPH